MSRSSDTGTGSQKTPISLLHKLQQRTLGAWERFVQWAGRLILVWCIKARLPAEDCEDVLQEVFLAVHKHLDNYRQEQPGSSFRGWLLIVTRSKIVDLIRRRAQHAQSVEVEQTCRQQVSHVEQELSDATLCEREIRQQAIRQAVAVLQADFAPLTWQAFWRTAVDGLNATAVANELGMKSAAIRQAKARVLARLREEFRDLID